jgi:hypothetical protein
MNLMKKLVLGGAVVALMLSFSGPAMAQDDFEGDLTGTTYDTQPTEEASCTQDQTGPFGPYAVWHYQEVFGIQVPVLDYYDYCPPLETL